MTIKKLKCGIMDKKSYIDRTIKIAKGEYIPDKDEPKVWFESIETLAQVLNKKNMELLEVIEQKKPHSITALAKETGRAKGNLSRTLNKLASYGIVTFEKIGRNKIPVVLANKFEISYGKDSLPDKHFINV